MDHIEYPGSPEGGGDAALLEGEARNEGGCLTIVDGDQTLLPVFASDDPRPGRFSDGDTVALGGGYSSSDSVLASIDAAIPAACAELTHAVFIVGQYGY